MIGIAGESNRIILSKRLFSIITLYLLERILGNNCLCALYKWNINMLCLLEPKNGTVQQAGKMECFLLGYWMGMSLSASSATPCLALLLPCLRGLCRGVCTTACTPLGLSDGWSECIRQPS